MKTPLYYLLAAVLLLGIAVGFPCGWTCHKQPVLSDTVIVSKPVIFKDTTPHLPVVIKQVITQRVHDTTVQHDTAVKYRDTTTFYDTANSYEASLKTPRGDSIIATMQSKFFPKIKPYDFKASIWLFETGDTTRIIIRRPWYDTWYYKTLGVIALGFATYEAGRHWR